MFIAYTFNISILLIKNPPLWNFLLIMLNKFSKRKKGINLKVLIIRMGTLVINRNYSFRKREAFTHEITSASCMSIKKYSPDQKSCYNWDDK